MDAQTHCLQNKQDFYAEEVISIFFTENHDFAVVNYPEVN